jgi:hypothetical protein
MDDHRPAEGVNDQPRQSQQKEAVMSTKMFVNLPVTDYQQVDGLLQIHRFREQSALQ